MQHKRNPWSYLIVALSILIPVVVSVLLFNPEKLQAGGWVKWLPHFNGAINTATSMALIAGFLFIKSNKPEYHKMSMLTAFTLGTLFLVSYLIYHSSVPSTSYGNTGAVRYLYYFLLLSHILLAVVVVPLVLLALYNAVIKNFVRHKKIVRYAFPVWLYVSVSGVIVYLMISPYYQ